MDCLPDLEGTIFSEVHDIFSFVFFVCMLTCFCQSIYLSLSFPLLYLSAMISSPGSQNLDSIPLALTILLNIFSCGYHLPRIENGTTLLKNPDVYNILPTLTLCGSSFWGDFYFRVWMKVDV